ncbi:hypothetical protein KR038_001754, partial [Drosophila bunnanda]
ETSKMESEEMDFLFNIAIIRAELFKKVSDPTKIDAVVKFAGNSMTVPNRLINVSDFDVNLQFPFSQSPNGLRQALDTNGVVVALRYDKSSLGNAVLFLADTFLDRIGPTMNDLFHEDTLSLIRQKDSIGTVSILLVLMAKCDIKEPDELERRSSAWSSRKSRASINSVDATVPPNMMEKEECFGLGPTFNSQDVLFVVGDPDPLLKIPDEPCSELTMQEGDERLWLDLQRYRSLNRRVIFPTDDPCVKPSLRQLKKLTEKFGNIIDSVTKKFEQVDMPTGSMALTESPNENTNAIPRTSKEVGTERWIPVPMESDDEHGVKPIRFCPVCLYSMSWLPKHTPCPRCNTKARPVLRAGLAEKQMSASEIVAEQLTRPKVKNYCRLPCDEDKPQPMVNSDSDAECPPCRCTCKDGKMCAHCRIRKLCEDIFSTEHEAKSRAVLEEEQRLAQYPFPRSSEDFSLIPGPKNDDRPYLLKVFSEMKSLYALHDTRKMKAIERRCKSETLLTMRSAHSLYQPQQVRHNAHIREHISRQKAGHKHCLPPDTLVPRNHGWNWSKSHQARKFGWRPGAILRAAVQVMRFFLDSNLHGQIPTEYEEVQGQNSPVLNIYKQDGAIFVTLRPLVSEGVGQKPITFKIVKSHLAVALRQIKRALKDQGFEKCTCHKSLMLCTCRDALEKFELNKALRRECRRRIIEPCPEHLVLTDTSVSDLEFNLDVHPPSRSCRSQIKAIRNSVNRGIQTSRKDQLPPPPPYPVKVPPYYRGFDCALGDRYMGTAFGWPGEHVFEDGVFGLAGGGPHGPNPMPCGGMRPAWGAAGGA